MSFMSAFAIGAGLPRAIVNRDFSGLSALICNRLVRKPEKVLDNCIEACQYLGEKLIEVDERWLKRSATVIKNLPWMFTLLSKAKKRDYEQAVSFLVLCLTNKIGISLANKLEVSENVVDSESALMAVSSTSMLLEKGINKEAFAMSAIAALSMLAKSKEKKAGAYKGMLLGAVMALFFFSTLQRHSHSSIQKSL